jgi:hypothetical protein
MIFRNGLTGELWNKMPSCSTAETSEYGHKREIATKNGTDLRNFPPAERKIKLKA